MKILLCLFCGDLSITNLHVFLYFQKLLSVAINFTLNSRTPNEAGFLYGVIQIKLLAFEVFLQWSYRTKDAQNIQSD